MDIFLFIKAAIIGIVEGITEYLPISSTGHMIIVGDFINFKPPVVTENYKNMFEVVIQLGAILAIVVLYWNKIRDSFVNLRKYGLRLWTNILIAFMPSAVLGLIAHDFLEEYLFNPITVTLALIVGGVLMLLMESKYKRGNSTRDIDDVKPGQALKIGLFQCLSLWPGMSRSASTIMGGWVSGLNNVAAAEFSFFLALPTMVAASGFVTLKAIKSGQVSFSSNEIIALTIGFIVSFIVALVVVDKFIGFLKKKPMRVFAYYRILIGIILLILAYSGVISFTT